jgi:nucleoside-diphosphate-sugar epimerase
MTTCTVIGAKGFIGSAVAREAARRFDRVTEVDLDNYAERAGTRSDVLVCAAGNARKYLDEKDPRRGFELSVAATQRILLDFPAGFVLLLSSGAVYPDEGNPERNGEDTELRPETMTRYGFHKWLAELVVRHYASRHLIVRMGGFVGPGLKKNAVHDLLSGGPLYVHPQSAFQLMDTRDLAKAVFGLLDAGAGGRVLNVSARGTATVEQLARMAGRELPENCRSLPLVRSELDLREAQRLVDLPETLETAARFIAAVRAGEESIA